MSPSHTEATFQGNPQLKSSHRTQLIRWVPIVILALLAFATMVGLSKDTYVSNQSLASEAIVTSGGGSLRRLLDTAVAPQSGDVAPCKFPIPQTTEERGTSQKKLPKGVNFIPFFEVPFSAPENCQAGDIFWRWDTKVNLGISNGGSGKDNIFAPFRLVVRDQTGSQVNSTEPMQCNQLNKSSMQCSTALVTRRDDLQLDFPTLYLEPSGGNKYTFGIELTVATDDWVEYSWDGRILSSKKGGDSAPSNPLCKFAPQAIEKQGTSQKKLPKGVNFIPFFEVPFSAPENCQAGDIFWRWISRGGLSISDGGSGKDRLYGPYRLVVRDQTGSQVNSTEANKCTYDHDSREEKAENVKCSEALVTRNNLSLRLTFPALYLQPIGGNKYTFGIELTVATDDWVEHSWDGRILSKKRVGDSALIAPVSEAASIVDAIEEEGGGGGSVEADVQSSAGDLPLFWCIKLLNVLLLVFSSLYF
jgi:hypothetical protein